VNSPAAPTNDSLDIALVTNNYPYAGRPNVGTFVAALAEAWAKNGESVDVIAPLPLLSRDSFSWHHPVLREKNRPTVAHPIYISYSSVRVGRISTQTWTTRSFDRAVQRSARKLAISPHVVYSHFLFPAGWSGLRLARRIRCPAVVALGESGFEFAEKMQGRAHVVETLRGFDGILSVSQENAEIVIARYGVDPSRIEIVPNAVDTELFQPHHRTAMRQKLGLPEDAIILSFAGHFIERKGALRVVEAMNRVEGLYGIFLGEGPQQPAGPRVLHAGRVAHSDVPDWLSASDIFVLPTLAEGSPNAVIEAMACGLPIVSSDIASVRETVDKSAAILVDPMDVDAIAAALEELMRDESLRLRLGERALECGRQMNLATRARRIRDWLEVLVRSQPQ
jgi:teichuronic acid biosynthesis glycosyltransferase TuaC